MSLRQGKNKSYLAVLFIMTAVMHFIKMHQVRSGMVLVRTQSLDGAWFRLKCTARIIQRTGHYAKRTKHRKKYLPCMGQNAGVFAKLRDLNRFNQVHLAYGVATWFDEIDLAPDAMYDEIRAHGKWVL